MLLIICKLQEVEVSNVDDEIEVMSAEEREEAGIYEVDRAVTKRNKVSIG